MVWLYSHNFVLRILVHTSKGNLGIHQSHDHHFSMEALQGQLCRLIPQNNDLLSNQVGIYNGSLAFYHLVFLH